MDISRIIDELSREVGALKFSPPVEYVYNPLEYAREAHLLYWNRYGAAPKQALLLGMNPGPWGMAQTGVPFGEITLVRDWMGLTAPVGKPAREHPKRPVDGFGCTRSEVSGKRLWGWAAERFGGAENFFERFFVANYCPLMFMEEGGKNRTPDKLKKAERLSLLSACDKALRRTVEYTGAGLVVGVGAFAADAARRALDGTGVEVGRITHPSPANPRANKGWVPIIESELAELGIEL